MRAPIQRVCHHSLPLTTACRGAISLRRRSRKACASRGGCCSETFSRALIFNSAHHSVEANFGVEKCVKFCVRFWFAVALNMPIPRAGQRLDHKLQSRVSPLRRWHVYRKDGLGTPTRKKPKSSEVREAREVRKVRSSGRNVGTFGSSGSYVGGRSLRRRCEFP